MWLRALREYQLNEATDCNLFNSSLQIISLLSTDLPSVNYAISQSVFDTFVVFFFLNIFNSLS